MQFMRLMKRILIYIGTILIFCISLISFTAYCSEKWMFKTWAHLSADELIYTITAPLEGTSTDMIYDYLSYCMAPIVFLFFLMVISVIQYHRKGREKKYYCFGLSFLILFSVVTLSYAGYEVYTKLELKDYSASKSTYSTFIEENYVAPDKVEIMFPEQKRNLIYIYLESMEMTYTDKSKGGAFEEGCIPELTKLGQKNEDFSGKDKELNGPITLPGTTWTIGGMFAQTSGLPLQISINAHAMDTQEHFFPEIITIGDILEKEGYSQELLIGTDATFGGRRLYFTEHGNYDILDYDYAVDIGRIPDGQKDGWGFEDYKLFQFAEERLTQLYEEGTLFNLTMLTVDTHFEDGRICEYCKDDYGEQYANVMACSSKRVTEFIKWVQEQPFYENTTIVLCGDHLTMDSDFCKDVPSDYQRRCYTAYINAAAQYTGNAERIYSTFDMFPTTLAALGVVIEDGRLGLGTDLFCGKPTLTEVYGIDVEKEELSKKSEFMEKIGDIDASTEAYENRKKWLAINEDRKEKDEKGIMYADVYLGNYDEAVGVFPVVINNFHNTEKGIASVDIAVWTEEDQSDLVWYKAQTAGDGQYSVYIQHADWGYKKGKYIMDCYVTDGAGNATMLNRREMEID